MQGKSARTVELSAEDKLKIKSIIAEIKAGE